MLYPVPVDVKPMENYSLLVTFESGEKRIYDVKPLIKGDWFGELRQPTVFNSVAIINKLIQWPDGQDIGPDDLYYNSIPASV